MARELKKRSVVNSLKTSDKDETLTTVNLKMRLWEKQDIDTTVKRLNVEQRPINKITMIAFIRKGLRLLKKELETKTFEEI